MPPVRRQIRLVPAACRSAPPRAGAAGRRARGRRG